VQRIVPPQRRREQKELVLKETERKMLAELVKNSRRSDRELAKAIGASQPTATRIRTKLEKEGYIREYTAIPDLSKAGYELLAITFVKLDPKQLLVGNDALDFKANHYKALMENSNAVILMKRGMGLGYDAVIISLHTNYSSCDKFRSLLREKMIGRITGVDTFLINLEDEENSLPFSSYTFAYQLMELAKKQENKEQEKPEKVKA
jgi:DNA-binding Lrp family transcriptional regulator